MLGVDFVTPFYFVFPYAARVDKWHGRRYNTYERKGIMSVLVMLREYGVSEH